MSDPTPAMRVAANRLGISEYDVYNILEAYVVAVREEVNSGIKDRARELLVRLDQDMQRFKK